jgi:hypothetical protein
MIWAEGIMSRLKGVTNFISAHRKPTALVGALCLAVLFSAGVSLAHHSNFSFLPNTQPFKSSTTTKIITVNQNIPFELQQEDDPAIASGKQSVQTPGEMGQRLETFRVTYFGGQEIRRVLLNSRVLHAAKDEVVLVRSAADLADDNSSQSTSVGQNNSDVTINSTGNCNIKTSGDIGDQNISSSNGSYHFSNTTSGGSSNNSISVNCTGN